MPKNRYYYYDHESCAFVELKNRRRRLQVQVAGVASVALILAMVLTWGMDHLVQTPQELSLQTENAVLQHQLGTMSQRMAMISGELDRLAETDRDLYRSLLSAEPIPEDVRLVGTGGADPYVEFDRYSQSAAALLRSSSQKLDRIERQLGLQKDSYREINMLAVEHEEALAQLPAIIPTDGRIVSGYGMRDHPILKIRRMHYGLDMIVPIGTPVVSSADGIVLEVGRGSGFGNRVRIEHPESGYVTIYAHLSRFVPGLRKGLRVKRGEVIAFSGNSGLSKAPHLHYEVHDLEGRALNPVYFFAPSMTPATYREHLRASEESELSFD